MGAGLAGLVATAELADAGKRVVLLDQEPEAILRRPGVLVLRRAVPRRLARAAPAAGARLPRAGPAGLVRHRRLRPRRGPLAAAVGRGLPAVRGGGEARLAQGAGHRLLPGRRLGRARRLHRHRARQLGAALPHRLGHRPRRRRAVRAPGPGRGRRAGLVELRFRHRVDELVVDRRRGDRRPRRGARAQRRRPRRGQLAHRGRRVRDLPRRPSSSPPAASAATTTWSAATGRPGSGPAPQRLLSGVPAHVDGRMLRGDRGRRRQRDQRATGCGTTPRASPTTRRSGRGTASGSCPGPSSLWLDATGSAAAGAAVPRLRHPRHARAHRHDRVRAHLVRRHAEDRREGVRALAAPSRTPTSPARTSSCWLNRVAAGVAAPVQAFLDRGEDFVVADHAARARRRDEPDHRRHAAARPGRPSSAEIVARDREIANAVHQGPAGHRDPRRPELPRRQAHPGGPAAPDARPGGRAADRRPAEPAHPQDPRRAGDRPVRPGAAPRRRGLPRAVRGRRGRRLRRRRHARLPLARGHLPRRLPVLRPGRRARAVAAAL